MDEFRERRLLKNLCGENKELQEKTRLFCQQLKKISDTLPKLEERDEKERREYEKERQRFKRAGKYRNELKTIEAEIEVHKKKIKAAIEKENLYESENLSETDRIAHKIWRKYLEKENMENPYTTGAWVDDKFKGIARRYSISNDKELIQIFRELKTLMKRYEELSTRIEKTSVPNPRDKYKDRAAKKIRQETRKLYKLLKSETQKSDNYIFENLAKLFNLYEIKTTRGNHYTDDTIRHLVNS